MAKKTIKTSNFSANNSGANIGLSIGDRLAIVPANLVFEDESGTNELVGVTTLTRDGYVNGYFCVIVTDNAIKPYILPVTSVTERFREPVPFEMNGSEKKELISVLSSDFDNRSLFVGTPTTMAIFEIVATGNGKLRWISSKTEKPIEWTLCGCRKTAESVQISDGIISFNGITLPFDDYCDKLAELITSRK